MRKALYVALLFLIGCGPSWETRLNGYMGRDMGAVMMDMQKPPDTRVELPEGCVYKWAFYGSTIDMGYGSSVRFVREVSIWANKDGKACRWYYEKRRDR